MIISAIRTVLLYAIILFTVRMMGKRQISELQTSELVVTLLMSNIASIPMQDTDQSMLSGIIPILVLLVCEIFLSYLMLRRSSIRKLICGNPIVVINDGIVDQKAMTSLRISTEDLFEQLRQKDIFKLEDVAFAIVETNGKMSIMKKPSTNAVTAKQLGVQTKSAANGMQTVIVSDGEIAYSSLKFCDLSESWLSQILKNEKTKLRDIFIMTADKGKNYHIIKKEGLKI